MIEPVVRIFDAFDGARQAREALLAEGFDAADISVSVSNDEAGPVAGNFTVGNMPIESERHTYARNYAQIEQVAQCVVTVAVADGALAARASEVLARFGARAAGSGSSGLRARSALVEGGHAIACRMARRSKP